MTASPLAQKATDAFNAPICETDPEIAELLDSELGRQRSGLEMIASENFVPRAVLQCQGSVLTNKYAEGYPGRFYHAEAYGVNPETFRIDPEIIRQRTFDGAKILAERLLADDVKANGIFVLTGGTDVHLVMVDLRNSEMDGQQGEDLRHDGLVKRLAIGKIPCLRIKTFFTMVRTSTHKQRNTDSRSICYITMLNVCIIHNFYAFLLL